MLTPQQGETCRSRERPWGLSIVSSASRVLLASFWWTVSAQAIQTSDYAVQVSAQTDTNPPRIILTWPSDSSAATEKYVVSRKARDESSWQVLETLIGTAASFSDANVIVGSAYEYQVQRVAPGFSGYGYVYAGIEVPELEHRGKVILVVDGTQAPELEFELTQLEEDLVGDGWIVIRQDVSRDGSVESVKEGIQAAYYSDPGAVKAVFLVGRIPVPYSGNIAPDGHAPDHHGAWPADMFYADMDGSWTDHSIDNTAARHARHRNTPGDGKFDQSQMPGHLELQVGRVDLSDMPAFGLSETELLRRYLNKNHRFRHKQLGALKAGLIADNFGTFNGEAFAASGWRNFSALFGRDRVTAVSSGQFIPTLSANAYLWAYGCGGGTYVSASGVGTASDFAATEVRAVFTMLFGSYFGDWDSENNLMRAVLAMPDYGLTCSWAGRPHYFYHHMALGETIGHSILLSQNNSSTYKQANYGGRLVHNALMGDPTLRLHPVAPPIQPVATVENGLIAVQWGASSDEVLGYHLYRAPTSAGPFERINNASIQGTTFEDPITEPGAYAYEVRAVKLETSGSGTYFNLSQGVFASATVAELRAPIPKASIIATAPETGETSVEPGRLSITLSSGTPSGVIIWLEVAGSALNGSDYLHVPSYVSIPPGSTFAEIEIAPIWDFIKEGTETATVTMISSEFFDLDPSAYSATVHIADNYRVGMLKSRRY